MKQWIVDTSEWIVREAMVGNERSGRTSESLQGNQNARKHGLYSVIRSAEFPRCAHCPSYIREACPKYDERASRCELILGWIDEEVQTLLHGVEHLNLVRDEMIVRMMVKTRYLVHYLEHRISYENLLIRHGKEGAQLSSLWEKKMSLERHLLEMMKHVGLTPLAFKVLFGEIPEVPGREKERWLEEVTEQRLIPGVVGPRRHGTDGTEETDEMRRADRKDG